MEPANNEIIGYTASIFHYVQQFVFKTISDKFKQENDKLLISVIKEAGHDPAKEGVEYILITNTESYNYYTPGLPQDRIEINVPDKFKQDFIDLKKQITIIKEEKSKINNYIRILLNLCNTIADLYEVFPPALHSILPEKKDSKISLTPEKLCKVQEIRDHYGKFIETRLLINFLLA